MQYRENNVWIQPKKIIVSIPIKMLKLTGEIFNYKKRHWTDWISHLNFYILLQAAWIKHNAWIKHPQLFNNWKSAIEIQSLNSFVSFNQWFAHRPWNRAIRQTEIAFLNISMHIIYISILSAFSEVALFVSDISNTIFLLNLNLNFYIKLFNKAIIFIQLCFIHHQ